MAKKFDNLVKKLPAKVKAAATKRAKELIAKEKLKHGFFALRDVKSGLYMTSQSISVNSFRPLGHEMSVYRSHASAVGGATCAIKEFRRLQPYWTEHGDEETKKVYNYDFQGIEVVPLKVTAMPASQLVQG